MKHSFQSFVLITLTSHLYFLCNILISVFALSPSSIFCNWRTSNIFYFNFLTEILTEILFYINKWVNVTSHVVLLYVKGCHLYIDSLFFVSIKIIKCFSLLMYYNMLIDLCMFNTPGINMNLIMLYYAFKELLKPIWYAGEDNSIYVYDRYWVLVICIRLCVVCCISDLGIGVVLVL